jgi:hypothetical protein
MVDLINAKRLNIKFRGGKTKQTSRNFTKKKMNARMTSQIRILRSRKAKKYKSKFKKKCTKSQEKGQWK